MTAEATLFAATLVLRRAVTKPDALAMIALVLDRPVEGAGSARPRISLGDTVWAEVEIPKFGEPPPLAIDVYSTLSEDQARLEALRLAARLEEQAGWMAVPDFPV
ncbi:MAG: hypothetical protein ACTHKX_12280 [Pseudolysinimonas sp.]